MHGYVKKYVVSFIKFEGYITCFELKKKYFEAVDRRTLRISLFSLEICSRKENGTFKQR